MNKSGPTAGMPTDDEIAADMFRWEYTQSTIDVSTETDPPNSVAPIIHIQRRLVGRWETADDQA